MSNTRDPGYSEPELAGPARVLRTIRTYWPGLVLFQAQYPLLESVTRERRPSGRASRIEYEMHFTARQQSSQMPAVPTLFTSR